VIQRIVAALAFVAGIIGIACVDMSAPEGPASISVLQLPSPSVAVGDTMRDSNGVVAPITVTAFDGAGNPIQADVQLFITDTLKFSHIGANNVLVGDSIGETRLLGQVGKLPTVVSAIPVTYAPTQLVPGVPPPDTIKAPFAADSAASRASSAVTVRLLGSNDSGSNKMIVHFQLQQAPGSRNPISPAVFLTNDAGKPLAVDTTDNRGTASIQVVVISSFLADADLLAGKKIDSAVVLAIAKYKGLNVARSPLKITVPIKVVLQ
jgi:hypothetical protein